MQKQLDFKLSKRLPKASSFYWNPYAASVKDYKICLEVFFNLLRKLHLQARVTLNHAYCLEQPPTLHQ
jgi:hypothetical protein